MGFISFLKQLGHDFKKGLDFILPIAETGGEIAVSLFAPGIAPLFNTTVTAVAMAEQKYAALGQNSAGAQKLADVINIIGPIIEQFLSGTGKTATAADVTNYINAVVTILNGIPAGALSWNKTPSTIPTPVLIPTPTA